jgi:hypothetical protein
MINTIRCGYSENDLVYHIYKKFLTIGDIENNFPKKSGFYKSIILHLKIIRSFLDY